MRETLRQWIERTGAYVQERNGTYYVHYSDYRPELCHLKDYVVTSNVGGCYVLCEREPACNPCEG